MNPATLNKVVDLAQKVGHIFVATANKGASPHIAAAASLKRTPEGRVLVAAWFCPETVANIRENPSISLVIWDSQKDHGYQMLGHTEQVIDMAMIDGIAPGRETSPLPQVERQLTVRVDRILEFKHAPHSDIEE